MENNIHGLSRLNCWLNRSQILIKAETNWWPILVSFAAKGIVAKINPRFQAAPIPMIKIGQLPQNNRAQSITNILRNHNRNRGAVAQAFG